ncbi:hypothetical protein I2I11_14930 [Pontibacter sp. 172403-2]|uniref:hypothetical protein n=1 Tax=Pontibacter rufus TaxID=2791028 RepID=UPI0018AF7B35|nr:hypothetical protein [Pontibacter sp. 172403-2]MBF9254597.1 hypothetical protein [Pontibacter sp. 172403-2]
MDAAELSACWLLFLLKYKMNVRRFIFRKTDADKISGKHQGFCKPQVQGSGILKSLGVQCIWLVFSCTKLLSASVLVAATQRSSHAANNLSCIC